MLNTPRTVDFLPPKRAIPLVIALLFIASLAPACSQSVNTVADAFPPGAMAAPWEREGEVWSGSFEQARPALGRDAAEWAPLSPQRVWLAVYRHDQAPDRRLTVRVIAFDTIDASKIAYAKFRPDGAKPFTAGDEGCWTQIGVLYRRGKMVIELFGSDSTWNTEINAAIVAGALERRLPASADENPQ